MSKKYITKIATAHFESSSFDNNVLRHANLHKSKGRPDSYSNIATKLDLDDYYKLRKEYEEYVGKSGKYAKFSSEGVVQPSKSVDTSGYGYVPNREQQVPSSPTITQTGKKGKYVEYTAEVAFQPTSKSVDTSGLGHTPNREQQVPVTPTITQTGKKGKYAEFVAEGVFQPTSTSVSTSGLGHTPSNLIVTPMYTNGNNK